MSDEQTELKLPPSRGPANTLDDNTLVQVLLEHYAQSFLNAQSETTHARWVECRTEVLSRLASRATVAPADKACEWKSDDEGVWWTTCGEGHVFEVDGPTENKMNFCCYCGKTLKEMEYEPDDD